MKRNFPIWLGVVLVILAGALLMNLFQQPAADQQAQKNEATSPSVVKSDVQQAPNFTLQDLKGNTVSLSDFHGKNIYLNFWASWCGPCKMEMPDLEKIYQKYKDKDLVVLAVNIAENKETVEAFIKANNFSFLFSSILRRLLPKPTRHPRFPFRFY
jgi:thiol-disulfide isomerase/thioredoxin